jgi:hypothetical protein
MALERDNEGRAIIRLDGSMGLGMLARLTVITSDKTNGTKEETFEFPYTLIDFKVLQSAADASYILGYRIERIVPADDQPIVFKLGEPSGDIR